MIQLKKQEVEERITNLLKQEEELMDQKHQLNQQILAFEEEYSLVQRQIHEAYSHNTSSILEEDYQTTFERMTRLYDSMQDQFGRKKDELKKKDRIREEALDEELQTRKKLELEEKEKEEKKENGD